MIRWLIKKVKNRRSDSELLGGSDPWKVQISKYKPSMNFARHKLINLADSFQTNKKRHKKDEKKIYK